MQYRSLWLVSVLFPVGLFASGISGQADWPTYGHDPGSTRYSPLKQVNTATVSKLKVAWTYHMAVANASSSGRRRRGRPSEATPIVINGVLFMPTPYDRVVALDAETGKELWAYEVKGGQPSYRGVEYWPGDAQSPASIFFGTSDGRLISLNAQTGKPVPGFGNEGIIDLKEGVSNGFPNGSFGLSSPPKIFRNLVITGARVQESPSLGSSGDTRAWDIHTGKLAIAKGLTFLEILSWRSTLQRAS